jgi:BirA family biotin operon repressor/biotin-[acetyl-CoA-carboxylase] ligase
VADGQCLLEFESLPSTMDVARLALMADDHAVIGVRVDYQSRGRGRRGSSWIAPPRTCLLVTYILRFDSNPDPARLAFAGALAVARAVEGAAGNRPQVKWPNDILLDGRKVAGILTEAHGRNALVGIGLNVNVDTFPPPIQQSATSLRLATGRPMSVIALEEAVRGHLFALKSEPWHDVLAAWRALDTTPGRRYVAIVNGKETPSTAVGVDDSGALLVRTPAGEVVPTLSATSSEA